MHGHYNVIHRTIRLSYNSNDENAVLLRAVSGDYVRSGSRIPRRSPTVAALSPTIAACLGIVVYDNAAGYLTFWLVLASCE